MRHAAGHATGAEDGAERDRRTGVCVVGSGTRFLSGISVYTMRLANALAASRPASVLTMRQLLPTRLYPGGARVGASLINLEPHPHVAVFDGVDWYWIPSIVRAIVFLARRRPGVVVMQWWTGTVLHTYLVIAIVARLLGARVIVEFHEILDTGEARILPARAYVGVLAPMLFRLAAAYTVHSQFDRDLLRGRYRLGRRPVVVVPHGPHDHYQSPESDSAPVSREAPAEACNLLFFGVIRPYKGLEDLVTAFDAIPPDEIDRYWLTVVGETWEGWDLPATLIERSRYRARITFVNRYVHDRELDAFLRGADAVVLPYLRSSLSGPLHVAMGYGLPIVITNLGGNPEAAEGYGGIVLTEPAQPAALRKALAEVALLRGRQFQHPTDWGQTAQTYDELFERLGVAKADAGAARMNVALASPARPRVAVVSPRYAPDIGGVEQVAERNAEGAVERGIHVEVLTTDPAGRLPRLERIGRVPVRRFPTLLGDAVYFVSPWLARWLYRRPGRYDLVHVHSYHTALAVAVAAVSQLRGMPLVVTAHYHGTGHTGARRALHVLYAPLGRWMLRSADAIICASAAEADLLRRRAGEGLAVTIVPPGIETSEIRDARPLARDAGRSIVLGVGRLEPYKQTARLLDALPLLPGTWTSSWSAMAPRGPISRRRSLRAPSRAEPGCSARSRGPSCSRGIARRTSW